MNIVSEFSFNIFHSRISLLSIRIYVLKCPRQKTKQINVALKQESTEFASLAFIPRYLLDKKKSGAVIPKLNFVNVTKYENKLLFNSMMRLTHPSH